MVATKNVKLLELHHEHEIVKFTSFCVLPIKENSANTHTKILFFLSLSSMTFAYQIYLGI